MLNPGGGTFRKWTGVDHNRLVVAADRIQELLDRNLVLAGLQDPMFQYPDTLTLLAAMQIIIRERDRRTVS